MNAGSGSTSPGAKFGFAIDPLDEAIAYETLMAIDGITESSLEKKFPVSGILGECTRLVKILSDYRQNGNQTQIEETQASVEKYLETIDDFSVCTPDGFHYKSDLSDAKTPLRLFYYRGDINLLDSPCVSVVGARQASEAGLDLASRVSDQLVKNDFTIVSGLAKGIDTVALQTAVQRDDARVIAVIGTPVDQYYPRENKSLQDDIADNHLLISQVPFYRYSQESFHQRRTYFPRRNITMSAISLATVIIEAFEGGGTLHQARAAIRQKRKLLIAESCFKNHAWVKRFVDQGAILFNDADQVIDLIKAS